MLPCGLEAADSGSEIGLQLANWAKADGRGRANGPSAGFILPDDSVLAPDVSWTLLSRRNAIPREQRRRFPRLVPDFIVEVMSPSDRLAEAQEKMRAWMANGAKLAWLFDIDRETIYVYRPGTRVKKLIGAARIAGDAPIDGFVLDLASIWP